MGNTYMEASQINYRGGETKMSVEEALKNTSGEAAAIAALQTAVGNLQSGKADLSVIAPAFSAETAYSVGDIVAYNGATYRCTNAHEGAWDAADFAATTIDAELKSLNSKLTNEDITSTFYGALGTGVTVSGQSWVSKIGNHIVGDIVLLASSAFTSTASNLLTLSHKPLKNIDSFCCGATTEWNAKEILHMYIAASDGVIAVQNDTGASDLDVAKIHLDYYTA